MICPSCHKELTRANNEYGMFWACDTCGGRAATFSLLRKTVVKDTINELWKMAREGKGLLARKCPSCEKQMLEIHFKGIEEIEPDEGSEATTQGFSRPGLDVCTRCQMVWFDVNESLPIKQSEDEENEIPQEAREAVAMAQVEMFNMGLKEYNRNQQIFNFFDFLGTFFRMGRRF